MFVPFAAPVQINPTVANGWEELTASDLFDLPASQVSGLLLEFRNSSTTTLRYCAARAGGSSDIFTSKFIGHHAKQWPVGLDAGYKFSTYVSHLTLVEVWALGYFTATDFFFADPIDISPSSAAAWEEQDLSVYVPAGVGVIVRMPNAGTAYTGGCRPSDSAAVTVMKIFHCTFILSKLSETISVDTYLSSLGTTYPSTVQLVGYIVYGSAELTTDMATVTPTASGSYEELPVIDADANAGIFHAVPYTGYVYDIDTDIRKNGSDESSLLCRSGMVITACDEAGLCQAYKTAGCAIYLSGYFLKVIAEVQRGACMMGDMWVG
jgi:hypothetical protein